MKKILIVVMMCMMSAVTFGTSKTGEQKASGNEVVSVVESNGMFFCTVQVTIAWYNEVGGFVDYSTATRTVNGPFGCTLAYQWALDAATELMPTETLAPIDDDPTPVDEIF